MKYALVHFQGEMKIPLPHNINDIDAVRYARVMTKFKVDKAELLSIEIMNDEDAYGTGSDGLGTSPSFEAA